MVGCRPQRAAGGRRDDWYEGQAPIFPRKAEHAERAVGVAGEGSVAVRSQGGAAALCGGLQGPDRVQLEGRGQENWKGQAGG